MGCALVPFRGRARPPAPEPFSGSALGLRLCGYGEAVSIVNRRNAVMGWAALKVAKRVGKKKARDAAPSVEGGKPNTSLVAVVLAAAAGAFAFLRGRRSEEN
jgi:hypothetical protein